MEKTMGKLVCQIRLNGEDVIKVLTTAPNVNVGQFVKTTPGVGKPFWYFPTIPAGTIEAADFTGAPVVVSDVAANNAAVAAITSQPEDVLTFASA